MKKTFTLSQSFKKFYKKFIYLTETETAILRMQVLLAQRENKLLVVLKRIKATYALKGKGPVTKEYEMIDKAKKEYKKKEQYVLEMLFAAYINAFNCYLSDIISEIFLKKPSFLENRDIKFQTILGKKDIKDIIEEEVKLAVSGYTYKSFEFLSEKIFSKKFKIQTHKKKSELKRICVDIEKRNLLVHQQGIIDAIFLKKTGLKYKEGNRIVINTSYLDKTTNLLMEIVEYIDKQAIKRFLRL